MTRAFQRFTAADPDALRAEIGKAREQLAAAEQGGDALRALDHAGSLVGMLTTNRCEAEAYAIGARHVEAARSRSHTEEAAWLLHALATAAQYLDRRDEADALYGEALGLCRQHGWRRLEHFVLHHWGRCKAEVHDFDAAERLLREALAIRIELGERRAETTRDALAELQRWKAKFAR
jgi:tetratricopeptide (TPR) repeat protein